MTFPPNPFDPADFDRKFPDTFQAHLEIRGDFGREVAVACRKSGMTAARFAEACIRYALAHAKKAGDDQ